MQSQRIHFICKVWNPFFLYVYFLNVLPGHLLTPPFTSNLTGREVQTGSSNNYHVGTCQWKKLATTHTASGSIVDCKQSKNMHNENLWKHPVLVLKTAGSEET